MTKPVFENHQAEIDAAIADEQADGSREILKPLTECEVCGDDFEEGKLYARRARGMNICIQCAISGDQTLDIEDSNDLAEDYWTRRGED